jgi:hypothetical protein
MAGSAHGDRDADSKNFIDGDWVDPAEGRTDPVYNPATGAEIAQAPSSTREDVDRAVKAARDATVLETIAGTGYYNAGQDCTAPHACSRPAAFSTTSSTAWSSRPPATSWATRARPTPRSGR